VHPGNRTVSAREGDTVLEAGLRHSVLLPYDCRNGGCGTCKCTLLNGAVDYGAYQSGALPDGERAQGRFLTCTAMPLTDLEIEYEEGAVGRESARLYTARVQTLERLAPDVMRVHVRLP